MIKSVVVRILVMFYKRVP